jgi:hypothetical protein
MARGPGEPRVAESNSAWVLHGVALIGVDLAPCQCLKNGSHDSPKQLEHATSTRREHFLRSIRKRMPAAIVASPKAASQTWLRKQDLELTLQQ